MFILPRPRGGVLRTAGLLAFVATLGTPLAAQDAPGTIVPDAEAAERALERSLVQSGQLLLPPGTVEIAPSFLYEYSEREQFLIFPGALLIDRAVIERNEFTAALDARLGLPGDMQIELRLPLVYVDQSIDEGLFDIGDDADAEGVGDVAIGFAKTLTRELGGIPDLVGRLVWDTDWGEDSDGPVSLTSDFNEIRASLSALWRLDPIALTAGVTYEYTLEKDDFRPGEVIGFNVGTSLAASPTTAIGMGFSALFRAESEFDGDLIEDSNQNQASVNFNVATLLARNTLLKIEFGAGLTEDSPDYFVGVSLPITR